MITIKLKTYEIKESDMLFIKNKQIEYSNAFKKLFSNQNYDIKNNTNFQSYEINCLKIDVKTKINQVQNWKDKTEDKIISIQNEINYLKSFQRNKKENSKLFKLQKKLSYLNKSLSKNITFGKRNLLKQISYLSNNKIDNLDKLDKLKKEYKESRILPLYYIGSLNDKNSNRYFEFNFIENNIIYKPNSKQKINLTIKPTKKQKEYLSLLNKVKDNKILPITIRLTENYIYIIFDEETLYGYSFNHKECKKEQNKHIDKEIKKNIYIDFCNEQKKRKLKGKIKNRIFGIDLNPNYIGCSITKNNKNIKTWCYDLTKLNNKEISSNKRRYEISIIYKNIFKLLKHYKVSTFVLEELNFKEKNINEESKEFNRQTKNIWNRNFQINLINKYCNINGIELIEVNPVYSSFIGNIQHKYFDPVNASIEIARRGKTKYEKGNNFYPIFNIDTIVDTMFDLVQLDVQLIKDLKNWGSLYKLFKNSGIKYRRTIDSNLINSFSLNNIKSLINIYCY